MRSRCVACPRQQWSASADPACLAGFGRGELMPLCQIDSSLSPRSIRPGRGRHASGGRLRATERRRRHKAFQREREAVRMAYQTMSRKYWRWARRCSYQALLRRFGLIVIRPRLKGVATGRPFRRCSKQARQASLALGGRSVFSWEPRQAQRLGSTFLISPGVHCGLRAKPARGWPAYRYARCREAPAHRGSR